jgi:hypothetical protein
MRGHCQGRENGSRHERRATERNCRNMRHIPPSWREPCEHTTADHSSSVKSLTAPSCLADSGWPSVDKVGLIPPGIKEIFAGSALLGSEDSTAIRRQSRTGVPGTEARSLGAPAHAAHQRSTAMAGGWSRATRNLQWGAAETDGSRGVWCMHQSYDT